MLKFKWSSGHRPEYKTLRSTGADIKARESITIPGHSMRLVPVGVWIEDSGTDYGVEYDIQLRARSSLFKQTDCILSNGVGTIDSDFRDEIQVPLYNTLAHPTLIPKGMSIAQLVIATAYPQFEFFKRNDERDGGFGSTTEEKR